VWIVCACCASGLAASGLAACYLPNPEFDGVATFDVDAGSGAGSSDTLAGAEHADGAAGAGGGDDESPSDAGVGGSPDDAAIDSHETDAGNTASNLPPGSNPACPRDNTLVLCLPFDGTAEDFSPNRHTETAEPARLAYTTGVSARAQGALAADASTSVKFAHDPLFDLERLTIEMWLMPQSPLPETETVLFEKGEEYGVYLQADGRIRCSIQGSAPITLDALPTSQWSHFACVWALQGIELWLDGKSAGGTGQQIARDRRTTEGVSVAGSTSNPTASFAGRLDNVRLWARPLSPQELLFPAP